MRVLIIDDQASQRAMHRMVIREVMPDARVWEAANGREGLRAAESMAPDLVLLDYRMPGLDGPEFLEEFRRDASLAEIPVMVATVLDASSIAASMANDPFVAIVPKPITAESVSEAFHDLCKAQAGE